MDGGQRPGDKNLVWPGFALWDGAATPYFAFLRRSSSWNLPLFNRFVPSAIDNVRETSAVQANLEYELATGQIDNPAEVTLAASKASTAAILLMEMRNKAVDTYNEIMRISL